VQAGVPRCGAEARVRPAARAGRDGGVADLPGQQQEDVPAEDVTAVHDG